MSVGNTQEFIDFARRAIEQEDAAMTAQAPTALVPRQNDGGRAIAPAQAYAISTQAASVCKAIVEQTAKEIQGRKFVQVEGWQAIAIAHGCVTSSGDVERVEGGFRAMGYVRRRDDGQEVGRAEGFVGEDEPVWFGGEAEVWDRKLGRKVMKTLPKRPDYAIRAMAQTRAISRACRAAFAHVVVLMNAGLQTTPAEEVPDGGFDDAPHSAPAPASSGNAPRRPAPGCITEKQQKLIYARLKAAGIEGAAFMARFGIGGLGELHREQMDDALAWIEAGGNEPAPVSGTVDGPGADDSDVPF